MSAREEIRKTDTDKLTVNKRTEKANLKKSENKTFRKAENCIIKITEKIRKQNINKSVKNEFFIEKTETASKKKLIIFSENASFFYVFFLEVKKLRKDEENCNYLKVEVFSHNCYHF